jgi:hypothetical protein
MRIKQCPYCAHEEIAPGTYEPQLELHFKYCTGLATLSDLIASRLNKNEKHTKRKPVRERSKVDPPG